MTNNTTPEEKVTALSELNNSVSYYYFDEDGIAYPTQVQEDATHVSNLLFSTFPFLDDFVVMANIEAVSELPSVIVYDNTAYLPITTESDYQSTLSILRSLEDYPCLDDEIWSRLQYDSWLANWYEWGEYDFVKGMAHKFSNKEVAEILEGKDLWEMYRNLVAGESDCLDIELAVAKATEADWEELKSFVELY